MDNVKDEATKQLHHCISKVKLQEEVRAAYMTWEDIIYYERQEAKDEGREEGKLEERKDAILKMIKLGVSKEAIISEYSQAEYDAAVSPQ